MPTTFKECCEITGENPNFGPNVTSFPEKERGFHAALYDWNVIRRAINGTWEPDLADHNQYKYEPFGVLVKDETKETGFGFSYSHFNYSYAAARVGARLGFESPEKVLHALKYFEQYFIKVLIKKEF